MPSRIKANNQKQYCVVTTTYHHARHHAGAFLFVARNPYLSFSYHIYHLLRVAAGIGRLYLFFITLCSFKFQTVVNKEIGGGS